MRTKDTMHRFLEVGNSPLKPYPSRVPFWAGGVSRRQLIKTAAGAAGAGFALSSGLSVPARAQEERDGQPLCGRPLPIPHVTDLSAKFGPFAFPHFFLPGPVDNPPSNTKGHDPSTITNFRGFIGQADLNFSGTGTDTATGQSAAYQFHTDMRFMKGVFIGADEREHRGTFAFI